MSKKAIELSLTFMVVVLIAIVVFILGIKFVYNLASQTNEINKFSAEQLDKKFAQLSCEGNDKVCIGIIKKIIKRDNSDNFGLKIINIENQTNFMVEVKPSFALDKDNKKILNDINFKYNDQLLKIDKNEEKPIGIGFEVPKNASSGTYVFDVQVKNEVNGRFQLYGEQQKIYIIVP